MSKNEPKKLAILLHDLDGGGMQKLTLQLIQELLVTQPDLQIDFVVGKADSRFYKIPSAVNLIDLGIKFDLRTKYLLSLLLKLIDYLRTNQPTVVLSHLPCINAVTMLAKFLSRASCPIVLVENTLPYMRLIAQEDKNKKVGSIGVILNQLTYWTYPQSDKVVAASSGIANELEKTFKLAKDKIEVIYNPVVSPEILEKSQQEVKHLWFQENEVPIFLAVGRLAPQKDFKTLLYSFAKVRSQKVSRLVILGEGEQRSALEALIRKLNLDNDVDLPGFVDNPYAYMNKAHALVLSSVWEVLPTVLIEALACGCAVISTDCDHGPREILAEGQYGALVPVGDINALADAMINTIAQSPDRQALQAYAQKFSIKSSTDRYKEVLAL